MSARPHSSNRRSSLRATWLFAGLAAAGCARPSDPATAQEREVRTTLARGGGTDRSDLDYLAPQVARAATTNWDDRREGAVTEFFDNGVRKSEGYQFAGRREGLWQFWHESGVLRWQGTYERGEIDGKVLTWHTNGELETVADYADDEREGEFRSFWDNGAPASLGSYSDGRMEGIFRFWTPDGELDVERSGIYSKDQRKAELPEVMLRRAEFAESVRAGALAPREADAAGGAPDDGH